MKDSSVLQPNNCSNFLISRKQACCWRKWNVGENGECSNCEWPASGRCLHRWGPRNGPIETGNEDRLRATTTWNEWIFDLRSNSWRANWMITYLLSFVGHSNVILWKWSVVRFNKMCDVPLFRKIKTTRLDFLHKIEISSRQIKDRAMQREISTVNSFQRGHSDDERCVNKSRQSKVKTNEQQQDHNAKKLITEE